MSLKQFHLFFIAVSILTCFGFGVWGVDRYLSTQNGSGILTLAIASLILGIVLIVYDVKVFQKFKNLEG